MLNLHFHNFSAPNGIGIKTFADSGDVYEGSWRDGKRSGHGVMKYADDYYGRSQYDGNWSDDNPSGEGILTFVHNGSYKVWYTTVGISSRG